MLNYTKQTIIDCFWLFLETKSIDKITVKDIVEYCNINRNTFYYYYADIYQLLEDALTNKLKNKSHHISDYESLYDVYIHSIAPFTNHKQAIQHIYNSKAKDVFESYIFNISKKYAEKFTILYATGDNLLEDDVEYLSSFYAYAIAGSIINTLKNNFHETFNQNMKNISDTFDITITDIIKQRLTYRYNQNAV